MTNAKKSPKYNRYRLGLLAVLISFMDENPRVINRLVIAALYDSCKMTQNASLYEIT